MLQRVWFINKRLGLKNSRGIRNWVIIILSHLFTGAQHDVDGNCVNFRLHVEHLSVQFDEQDPEVGSAEIERQKFALFWKKISLCNVFYG